MTTIHELRREKIHEKATNQTDHGALFKRLVAAKSVEQETMEMFAHGKKIAQHEKDLRELLMYTYGANAYQELLSMRRSIRDQREKTVYAQVRRRKALFWGTVQGGSVVILTAALYEVFMFLYAAIAAVN